MPVGNKVVAFYARVSKKDRRGPSGSICAQFTLMENSWGKIAESESELLYLSDDGYSGRDTMRPAFRRLLGLVALGEVAVLIVKDFSRLSRDYLLFGMLVREIFVRYNVRFLSVAENYDSFNRGTESLGMDIRSVFNEYYCHDISRKVKMAFDAKKENGDYSCLKPPFGYKWNADKTGWEVVPAEAEAVREIFSRYADGMTLKNIGLEIEKRYDTRKSNWEPSVVWQILHNPAYIGYQVWHKYETKTNPYGEVRAVPRSEWELRRGTHKAIVQGDEWESFILQEEKALDKRGLKKGKRHIFHGLTKCGCCGRALSLGRRDKHMLCCNHCSGHEEKRIETGRLYEVCLFEFYKECGVGEIAISECELFLHHFIRRIEVGADDGIVIFWNFTKAKL